MEEEEEAARWRRLGELGYEAGLRAGGFSEDAISAIVSYAPWSAERMDGLFRDNEMVEVLSAVQNGRALLLAVLGRGDTPLQSLRARSQNGLTDHTFFLPQEAAALCANLSSNAHLKELDVSRQVVFGSPAGCALLGDALSSNSALQRLELEAVGMGSEALRGLVHGLKGNRTLETLDLRRNPLSDEGIAHLAELLRSTSSSLKVLDVSHTESGLEGAKQLSSALEQNTSLEVLKFSGNRIGGDGMKILLQPFSRGVVGQRAVPSEGQRNTTVKELELGSIDVENMSRESLAWMIRTNRTLARLDISPNPLLPQDWIEHIFPALRKNETLKELSLLGCKGLAGDAVHDALMDVLQFSWTGLGRIQLSGSGMQSSQGQVDEELRVNREYRDILRSQTPVQAKSGRLVLCGFAFAGKSTIRKTMERIAHNTPFRTGWRKLRKALDRNVRNEAEEGMRGFDVVILNKQPSRTWVWDFAGQKEYSTVNDCLFPDIHNSCFLYVCCARYLPDRQNPEGRIKRQCSMREECEYWMRFLASTCKPRWGGDGHERELPRVRFVLTNKDTLSSSRLDVAKQRAERVVVQLKEVFKDVIELCETVEVVNAHSGEDVERLMTLTTASLKESLAPRKEYAVCDEVRNALFRWSAKNPSKPVLSLQEFYSLCEGGSLKRAGPAPKSCSKEALEAVLAYLNDLGDVIYARGVGFVVANPRWFGVGVLGVLIDAFGADGDSSIPPKGSQRTGLFGHHKRCWKLIHEEGGFVERHSMEDLLEHSLKAMHLKQTVPAEKLILMMIELEMCFQKEPGNADSPLFIPALFRDERERAAKGTRPVEWRLERDGPFTYLGRRLECQNKSTTFLTPGFFPRLQVHLCNYVHQRGWTGNGGFAVERNLICFADSGVEVCVEYSGDLVDQFVDILVRSSKPYAVALDFIAEHVVKKALQFCASPQGCQGVLLVEGVIRPSCVRNLHLCVDRKAQSVLVSILQQYLETDQGSQYYWSTDIEDENDSDLALDLLEGEGSYMRLLAANQLDVAPGMSSSIAFRPKDQSQDILPRLF